MSSRGSCNKRNIDRRDKCNCHQIPPSLIVLPSGPGPRGPPGPLSTYVYARDRFVDPIGGSDTNDGGVTTPFRTIAAALASVGPLDSTHRYNIHIFPGPVTEPTIIWRPWVSLFGTGKDSTIINSDLIYTAGPEDINFPPRFDFSDVGFIGAITIDVTASINTNIRFVDSRISLITYNSNVSYATNPNNLFFESTIIDNLIANGGVHIFDNNGEFTTVTILNGPAPPFVEIVGGLVQGTVTLNGNAELYTTGVEFTANVIGNIVGGVTPYWETSADSITPGTITGSVQLVDIDNLIAGLIYPIGAPGRIAGPGIITTNFTVTKETIVLVDATAGPVTITLPPAVNYVGREVTIKKIDATLNPVTIIATASTIDGAAAQVLTIFNSGIRVVSNSVEYFIVGRF